MKKALLALACVATVALAACGAQGGGKTCEAAKLNASEPYNNNEMGPETCPADK